MTSGVGTYLSLGFSRAVFTTGFVLGVWGENKGSILLHLIAPGVWPRGPLSPTSQIYPELTVLVGRQLL